MALLAVAVGSRIPLPGLNAHAVAKTYSGNGMARISILALGVMPLYTVLAHAEIAKLIFPSLARWQAASARNVDRMNLVIRALILVLAAMQGYGVMVGLEAGGLADDDTVAFVPVGIAGFLGSTALLIWLADRITLPGLGNGFWLLLLAIPFLNVFPGELMAWLELARSGAASTVGWLFTGLYVTIATALVVSADSSLSARDGDAEPAISRAMLVWPPFLANIVAGYVISLLLLVAPDGMFSTVRSIELARLALNAVLILLFVYAYACTYTVHRPSAAATSVAMTSLLVVAGTQIVVFAGADLMNWVLRLPLDLNGRPLIALVVVTLALRRLLAPTAQRCPRGDVPR